MTADRRGDGDAYREEIIEAGFHAYADGMLDGDPALRTAIEERLARDPAARQKVEDWKAINAAIRASVPPVAGPAPHLAAAFGGRRRHPSYRLMAASGALAATLAIGFFAGHLTGNTAAPGGMPEGIIAAMTGGTPERTPPAATRAAEAAMAGADAARAEMRGGPRLGMVRAVPDLSGAGFDLQRAARATTGDGHPMLRAYYGNATGEEVELLIMALPGREATPETAGEASGRVFWSDGHLAYGLAAASGAPDLEALADMAAAPHNWDMALDTAGAPRGPVAAPQLNPGFEPITGPGSLPEGRRGS